MKMIGEILYSAIFSDLLLQDPLEGLAVLEVSEILVVSECHLMGRHLTPFNNQVHLVQDLVEFRKVFQAPL